MADTAPQSLLEAFAPASLVELAKAHAERGAYLCHEFGDSTVVLAETA
jgi:hypothetical protein